MPLCQFCERKTPLKTGEPESLPETPRRGAPGGMPLTSLLLGAVVPLTLLVAPRIGIPPAAFNICLFVRWALV
jgi:hypothetical protein